ncbi:MAG: DUF4124 domain-containing protein [Pedobacter sp.]|nr:DUF4124 domain-containing protein [Pedobacter sp.]
MTRETVIPFVVIAAVAAGGWYYREPLKQQFEKSKASMPFSAASSQEQMPLPEHQASSVPHKDTIYRWVDDKGVTHYDQQASAGSEAMVIDQSRIQSLNQYGNPQASANGSPVVEANGDAASNGSSGESRKSLRAVDRFPQTQVVNP